MSSLFACFGVVALILVIICLKKPLIGQKILTGYFILNALFLGAIYALNETQQSLATKRIIYDKWVIDDYSSFIYYALKGKSKKSILKKTDNYNYIIYKNGIATGQIDITPPFEKKLYAYPNLKREKRP